MLDKLVGKGAGKIQGAAQTFSEQQLTSLHDFATTVKLIQDRLSTGTGGMLIQLVQGGALLHLVTGGPKLLDIPILIGPEVMARIMVSKTGAKWLTEGLRMPRTAAAAIDVSAKLLAIVGGRAASAQATEITPPAQMGQPLRAFALER